MVAADLILPVTPVDRESEADAIHSKKMFSKQKLLLERENIQYPLEETKSPEF